MSMVIRFQLSPLTTPNREHPMTRPLADLQPGDRFTIEGDLNARVFTVIPGGTTTKRGSFLAARSPDGVPAYYSSDLRVISV